MSTEHTHSLDAKQLSESKDKHLKPSERTFLGFLQSGKQFSGKQLTELTDYRDPRGIIRFLRKRGIAITGTWTTQGGRRFKLYSFERKVENPQLNLFP